METSPFLSVVIPLYNEKDILPELLKRLENSLNNFNKPYEVIFVDDGSTDGSFDLLQKQYQQNHRWKVIQFSRNFGQHMALTAGLDEAAGDYIVIMDSDLQDRPEEIMPLYNTLMEGYDMVYGIRQNRRDGFIKKFTSKIFWFCINKASGLHIPPNQCMMRIFNRKVLETLLLFKESHRFYAGLFAWIGFRQGHLHVQHAERTRGKTKYSFSKLLLLTVNATLGFSHIPLYFISYVGIIFAATAVVFGIFILLKKVLFGISLIGWPSLIVLVSFMGGVTIFSIGILGLYIGRLYHQSLNRPLFVINKKLT